MASLPISDRLAQVRASATVAITTKAAELRAAGKDLISLSAGEPAADTPQHICEAATRAMTSGETHYTSVGGTPALRAAIRRKFARDNGLDYADHEVLASSGGKELCYLACQALINPGDEGLVFAPYWVSYPGVIKLAGGVVKVVATHSSTNFTPNPDALRAQLSAKTRILFLNSPGNPTGAVYSRETLLALGEVLVDFPQCLIISDEIYEPLVWAGEASLSIAKLCPDLRDRVLTLNGLSKSHAMTGWRLGYAGGPEWLIQALKKLQSQTTTHPSSISQAAAIAALDGPQTFLDSERQHYQRRSKIVCEAIEHAPRLGLAAPAGAFYALIDAADWLRTSDLKDDIALCEALLDEAGVACVPGSAFGAPGMLRISFATDDQTLQRALVRLLGFRDLGR